MNSQQMGTQKPMQPEALQLRKKLLCASFPDAWEKVFNTMMMRELKDPAADERTLINFMQQWKTKTASLDAERNLSRQRSGHVEDLQDLKAEDMEDLDVVEEFKTSVQDILLSPIQAFIKDIQTIKETISLNDILQKTIISVGMEITVEVETLSTIFSKTRCWKYSLGIHSLGTP